MHLIINTKKTAKIIESFVLAATLDISLHLQQSQNKYSRFLCSKKMLKNIYKGFFFQGLHTNLISFIFLSLNFFYVILAN